MTLIDQDCDRLEAEIADLAGVLNLANARLVELMERCLTDESWAAPGVHSPNQWLSHRAGVSPERAKVIVRVARRRSSYPEVIAAFDAGELSLEQVAELVKAPEWADGKVLDWGRVASVARLRKTIRRNWFTGSPDGLDVGESTAAADRDRLSTRVTDDHRWRVNGELDLGRGSVVDAALREARESLFERGQHSISLADCLVELSERYLDGIRSPVRRDRSRAWIHIDVTGTGSTTDGWRLPDTVRDRICCDGDVQPVWERDGVPFSVGRAQRIVPERTRRIIERRDRGCRVPGCTNARYVEIHHIVHWLDRGPTDTWNLASLCPHHHRLHHQGSFGIAGNADEADGLVFTDARGRPLEPCGRPNPSGTDPPKPDPPYRPPPMDRVDFQWVGLDWIHPDEMARRRNRFRHN